MTYVPDPDGIGIVAAGLCKATPDGAGHPSIVEHRATAAVVLTALAAAGRLLPTGGQDRIEWGVEGRYGVDGPIAAADGNHEAVARRLAETSGGALKLVSRKATDYSDDSEYLGPWVAVDEGSAK